MNFRKIKRLSKENIKTELTQIQVKNDSSTSDDKDGDHQLLKDTFQDPNNLDVCNI